MKHSSPMPGAAFRHFVAALQEKADSAGLSSPAVADAIASLRQDNKVLSHDRAQPEHIISAGEYFDRLVTPGRVHTGREKQSELSAELASIEKQFGVPASVLLAIWGVESNYGAAIGDAKVIENLANLSFHDARRKVFWSEQLLAALRIVEHHGIAPDQLLGSWAGAMGQTQFMPSTYLDHAIDFDRDGRPDIWCSVPDALASTANYLVHSGWNGQFPWGCEVSLEKAFDFSENDPSALRPASKWCSAGITLLGDIHPAIPCRLVLPAGWRGPAFLVTTNFDAVLTYNRSTSYALSVCCLADMIARRAGPQTPWPADAPLTRLERIELQQHLADSGYDTNGIDGILGSTTVRAARAYQLRHALEADGHPGAELLRFMHDLSRARE